MHGEITLMRFSQWLLLCWAQLNLQLLIIGLSLHVSLGSMILTDKTLCIVLLAHTIVQMAELSRQFY